MTGPGQAVFLSYAHEDVDAARRVADALRAAGIEVWFDQSELRGGDAWDAKIRGQIQECALFVPIISATTQARREAYFRLEWKLADERTHLMAEGTPFLVPVVIDDTRERGALVPKSFLAAQWTRLPSGASAEKFMQRVAGLLAGDVSNPVSRPASPAASDARLASVRRSRPVLLSMTAAIAIAGIGVRRAKAQDAIDRAVREAPDSPVVIGALGVFYLDPQRDVAKAVSFFERQTALQPGNPEPLIELASVKRRMLQHPEAIAFYRRAAALDPADSRVAYHLTDVFAEVRRYDEAIAEEARLVALVPHDYGESYFLARLSFTATGSAREMEKWFAAVPPQDQNSTVIIGLRKRHAWLQGNVDEAIRLDEIQPYFDATENMDPGQRRRDQAIRAALDRYVRGNLPGLRQRLGKYPEETRAKVALDPTNHDEWEALARIELLLGNKEEALRCIERAVELVPEAVNPRGNGVLRFNRATIQAWCGNKDAALAELGRQLAKPLYVRVHQVRRDLWWKPLHGDPRFEAILNDPKNHAPLF